MRGRQGHQSRIHVHVTIASTKWLPASATSCGSAVSISGWLSSSAARHPYTQSLLDAVPVVNPKARRRRTFLTADEIVARTPHLRAADLEHPPLLDTADPQLVALAGSHFVEAIVTDRVRG